MRYSNLIIGFVACVCAFVTPPSVTAQQNNTKLDHQIIFFGDGEKADTATINRVVNKFYFDQFRHFQDPLAPYFMFMSKDATLSMGIGGVVRMRGWYDWGGAMNNSGVIPADIDIPNNPARDKWFGTTPAGTALFFRVIGRSSKFGIYQLYVEANFNGYNSRGFTLKKAYASVNDWTIGYAHSTFSDPAAQPATVDGQGPNAEISATNVLVRYMHTFKGNHWVIAGSVETPDPSIPTLENVIGQRSSFAPNLATFVQYQSTDGMQHLRLSGIMRVLPYRDLVDGTNRSIIGWGAHVSTMFNIARPLKAFAAFNMGHGYESLSNDLSIMPMDLLPDNDRPGRMYAPFALGWYGALQYNFTPSVFSSVMFGEMRNLQRDTHLTPDGYKYGLYGAANVFWNLTKRIQTAAEFNLAKRQDFDGRHRWVRRVSIMAQFSF